MRLRFFKLAKERLDKFLVDLGYFDNKSKAAACIMAGDVKIDDVKITKSGFQINPEKVYQIEIKSMPYVSRGGFKLERALEIFDIKIDGRVCLDAGASTGGFSDCLLQNGAKKIYAVDVGHGQIAWKLRCDERVKVIEKTNLKNCAFKQVYAQGEEIADLLVMDVSFISITKVLANLKTLLDQGFHQMVCLIKPQFEAGKDLIEKGGIVTDKKVHIQVIEKVLEFSRELGYFPIDLTYSPIKGPSGNIEYLLHLKTIEDAQKDFVVADVVDEAFGVLNKIEPLPSVFN